MYSYTSFTSNSRTKGVTGQAQTIQAKFTCKSRELYKCTCTFCMLTCTCVSRALFFIQAGGCKAGTFDVYPKHSEDPYANPKPRRESDGKVAGQKVGVFKPSPGPKTMPTSSVVQQNVIRCEYVHVAPSLTCYIHIHIHVQCIIKSVYPCRHTDTHPSKPL